MDNSLWTPGYRKVLLPVKAADSTGGYLPGGYSHIFRWQPGVIYSSQESRQPSAGPGPARRGTVLITAPPWFLFPAPGTDLPDTVVPNTTSSMPQYFCSSTPQAQ